MGKKANKAHCKGIREIDMFGYQVQLKYKGDESMRKSMIGGFFTVLALGIVLSSLFTKLNKVNSTNLEEAKISEYDIMQEKDQIKPIKLKDT